jgi:phosphoglycerol geranylgeranyltransferase
MSLLEKLKINKENNRKQFAVLLDPDKSDEKQVRELVRLAESGRVDYFFVGGSLITNASLRSIVSLIKRETDTPVILFPGSNLHISPEADAILFLSLISGRNPEFLIGQHVIAAPILKETGLEILPTGYMLVDCGKQTTVSYISNTTPLPYDKPAVAACTAMAGEMLGLKLIYLDGGSGALKPVSEEMIRTVRKAIEIPLIVGGGINTPERAAAAFNAGADMIVVGNAIEKNPQLIREISEVL